MRSRTRADTRGAGSGLPRLEDVEAAARQLAGRIVRTPVIPAPWLAPDSGGRVQLKAELLQYTGSFKIRGVIARLARLTETERRQGVIGISAGNHAQALAYGCRAEGVDCTVVMWDSASAAKKAATRGFGASIDDSASGPAEAFERMEEIRSETGRLLIHPFADPTVIAGQGTVGLELARDVGSFDTVVVPVGGGGLVCGIAAALRSAGQGPRVVGVEPESAAALAEGVAAGSPVGVDPASIADGLLAPFTSQICIDMVKAYGVELVTVEDSAIERAMRRIYTHGKLACEPAAAASVAAIETGAVEVEAGDNTVAIVSGGNVGALEASDILTRE